MQSEVYKVMFEHQSWHWWYRTKREYLRTVLQSLYLPKSAKIFELGSGVGANFPLLRQFAEVTGVESSDQARKFSKSRYTEEVVKGNLNTYRLLKNKADVVCVLDVLYHQNIKDDVEVLKRVYEGLKNSGWLIVMDCAHPSLYGPHDRENMARQRYSKKELKEKVEAAGFTVVRSSYIFAFSFPLFVMARLLQKITSKDSQKEDRPGLLNSILSLLGKVESRVLSFTSLPFGSSILIVAHK